MRILGSKSHKKVTRLPSLIIPKQGQCHHQELCTALAGKFISNHPTISCRNDMITCICIRSHDKKGTFGTERMNRKFQHNCQLQSHPTSRFLASNIRSILYLKPSPFLRKLPYFLSPKKNKKHQRFGTQLQVVPTTPFPKKPTNPFPD